MSTKLYSNLLRLYPREWRQRYEDEFVAMLEYGHTSLLDIADIALGALDARLRPQRPDIATPSERRSIVNKTSFIKWSGIAGMAGSALVLLGFVGQGIFNDNEYPYTYSLGTIVSALAYLAGLVLMLVGAIGLGLAYARRTGGLGQVGLLVAYLGLGSLIISSAGRVTEVLGGSISGWWEFYIVGLLAMLAGLALFALAGLRQKVLPAAGAIPMAIGGFGSVALLLLAMRIGLVLNSKEGQFALLVVMFLLITAFLAGFFIMGRTLWRQDQAKAGKPEPATVG